MASSTSTLNLQSHFWATPSAEYILVAMWGGARLLLRGGLGLGMVAGTSLACYSSASPSSAKTFEDEIGQALHAPKALLQQQQHSFLSLFPRQLIKPLWCEEANTEVEHKVEDVLRASFDLFKSVDGLVMFFTHDAHASGGPPAGRTVRCYKTPTDDAAASDTNGTDWCSRLWIPTNVYSDKVQELNKNDSCSVGAYDRFGNYFVMQGHCVSKVTVESGAFYKSVLNKLWEENDDLWNYFQDGPNGKRFVLLEFVPTKITVISAKFNIADENNSWKPATIARSASSISKVTGWRPWGKKAPTAEVNLGDWKTVKHSKKQLKNLRGSFDIKGEPV